MFNMLLRGVFDRLYENLKENDYEEIDNELILELAVDYLQSFLLEYL